MQVPKPEVRARILAAAKEEFSQHGYKKTAMRAIARRARITPGNIYAYYEGKEQLFEAVVAPTAERMRRIYDLEFAELPLTSLEPVVEELLQLFLAAKTEFTILLLGSDGSKYAGCRQLLIEMAALRIEQWLLPLLPRHEQLALLPRAWASAIIEGLLILFNEFTGREEQLRDLLSVFLSRLFPMEMP